MGSESAAALTTHGSPAGSPLLLLPLVVLVLVTVPVQVPVLVAAAAVAAAVGRGGGSGRSLRWRRTAGFGIKTLGADPWLASTTSSKRVPGKFDRG